VSVSPQVDLIQLPPLPPPELIVDEKKAKQLIPIVSSEPETPRKLDDRRLMLLYK
jgi:hypothetical protein